LSKHREVLRRGIRSLIQETSRELADLEGREAADGASTPSGESPTHPAPADQASGVPEWGAPPVDGTTAATSSGGAGAAEDASGDGGTMLDAEVLAVEVRELAPRRTPDAARDVAPVPATPGEIGAEIAAPVDHEQASRELNDPRAPLGAPAAAEDAGDPGAGHETPEAPTTAPALDHGPPPAQDVVSPMPGAVGVTRAAEPAHAPADPARPDVPVRHDVPVRPDAPARPDASARIDAAHPAAEPAADRESAGLGRRREQAPPRAVDETRGRDTTRRAPSKKAAARRRPRRRSKPATSPWALDGVDPRQVHSRRGVCSAYFINPECWRVPDAYCNTALHVCAMRECPVYHLHRDVLERRFASKYKHLW